MCLTSSSRTSRSNVDNTSIGRWVVKDTSVSDDSSNAAGDPDSEGSAATPCATIPDEGFCRNLSTRPPATPASVGGDATTAAPSTPRSGHPSGTSLPGGHARRFRRVLRRRVGSSTSLGVVSPNNLEHICARRLPRHLRSGALRGHRSRTLRQPCPKCAKPVSSCWKLFPSHIADDSLAEACVGDSGKVSSSCMTLPKT